MQQREKRNKKINNIALICKQTADLIKNNNFCEQESIIIEQEGTIENDNEENNQFDHYFPISSESEEYQEEIESDFPFTNIERLIKYCCNEEEHQIYKYLNQITSFPKIFGIGLSNIKVPDNHKKMRSYLTHLMYNLNRRQHGQ